MPDKHAFLSASSADRWIHCPPSAKINYMIADKSTSFTQEGTEAHELCEYEVKTALHIVDDNGNAMMDPRPNLQYYDAEMQDCADGYRDYILDELTKAKETCPDPYVCVETRLDYSRWVEDGFGTGDCLIIADGTLHVVDFKYGVGVKVSANMNPQMLCYGLGALDTFGDLYDIETIQLTIYQPRRGNIDTFEISKENLLKWADEVLAPAAKLAYVGQGEFNCGSWCKFCKIKGTCTKRANENLEMDKLKYLEAATMSPEEIAWILPKLDELISWADDLKKDAQEMAISGKKIPGYKLVNGRANRTYKDEKKVAQTVKDAGYDPYDLKLKGVTAMTKYLGKKKFNELLGDLVYKPPGSPTLVPESDKRAEYAPNKDANEEAKRFFTENNQEEK